MLAALVKCTWEIVSIFPKKYSKNVINFLLLQYRQNGKMWEKVRTESSCAGGDAGASSSPHVISTSLPFQMKANSRGSLKEWGWKDVKCHLWRVFYHLTE